MPPTLPLVLVGLLVLLGIVWLRLRWKRMHFLKDLKIPGPTPHFLFGNLREFLALGANTAHYEWTRKYGKVFGFYFGGLPMIVVGDLNILKSIQMKDFQNFSNRPVFIPGGPNVGKTFNNHLVTERDDVWRKQRAVITPSFTTGKLKKMVPTIQEALDEFLSLLKKNSDHDHEFDIGEMYKALTLDVICRTIFGVNSRVQSDPEDPFLLAAHAVFPNNLFSGLRYLSICFPEWEPVLTPLRTVSEWLANIFGCSKLQDFDESCKSIVSARRTNSKNSPQDMLQLMLNATTLKSIVRSLPDDDLETDLITEKDSSISSTSEQNEKMKIPLTDLEVISNTFLMLIAGHETTSSALSFTTHILVNRPEVQEKLRHEVQALFLEYGVLNYHNIFRCEYLDQVLQESLRLYPPVPLLTSREARHDAKYGDLFLPKGSVVQISLNLNRDPDLWQNPDVFDPERWSAENRGSIPPLAFQAFGAGPRSCVGMRLAQMEVKLALATILLEYRLLPGDTTEMGDIAVVHKLFLMSPKNGVLVKAHRI